MSAALDEATRRFRASAGDVHPGARRYAEALVRLAGRDADGAAGAFHEALAAGVEPVALRAIYGYGLACLRSEPARLEEAERAFRFVLEQSSGALLSPWVGLGLTLLSQGRAEEALSVQRAALARHPEHPDRVHVLADACEALDRLERWVEGEQLCAANTRDGGHPDLLFNLATFRFRQGDTSGARAALIEASTRAPHARDRALAVWREHGDGGPLSEGEP